MTRTRGAPKSLREDSNVIEVSERVANDAEPDLDFSMESPPAKKPRKKSQAFGVPKTAALKAKIDRNAAESPLLRLPREVRARIWKLVIGDKLFHIRTICLEHGNSDNCYCRRMYKPRKWVTSCCMLLCSEEDLFQRSKIPIEELMTQDEGEFGLYLDAAALRKLPGDTTERRKERQLHLYQHPHLQCHKYVKEIRGGKCNILEGRALERYKTKEHVVQAQILQVCRQVYIEANPILWSSNTLLFSNAVDFNRFMSDRVASQRASMTKLLLDLSWECGEYGFYREGPKATTNGIINSLLGLRTLHLYIQDGVQGRINYPGGTHIFNDNQEIKDWQSETKAYEARERFTDFKRLPLQDVTVLMIGEDRPPSDETWSVNMQDWRLAVRAKYSENVREAILDSEGPQKFEKERADAKAAREAELAVLRLSLHPCNQASNKKECAEINQADLDGRKILNGKPRSSKPKAQACKSEHICLMCFDTLKRTREEARECSKPGNCGEAVFGIMFKNSSSPAKSMKISIQSEDTISTILDRYVCVSGINKYLTYNIRLRGVELKPEATVQAVGLKRNSKMELTVAINKTKAVADSASASFVSGDFNAGNTE